MILVLQLVAICFWIREITAAAPPGSTAVVLRADSLASDAAALRGHWEAARIDETAFSEHFPASPAAAAEGERRQTADAADLRPPTVPELPSWRAPGERADDAQQRAAESLGAGASTLLLSPEMFLLLYLTVAWLCLRGSCSSTSSSSLPPPSKSEAAHPGRKHDRRTASWDFLKLLLCYHVVLFHCSRYLFEPEDRNSSHRAYIDLFRAYLMPCFIFVSGILGSSLRLAALVTALSYMWLNVLLMLIVFFLWECGFVSNPTTPGLWYLWCLPSWRCCTVLLGWALQPCWRQATSATSKAAVYAAVLFAVHLLCYAAFHSLHQPGSQEVASLFFFYLPTFAAGALLPRQQWENLYSRHDVGGYALLYMISWYCCLFGWRWFREWYQVTCLVDGDCYIEANHFPDAVYSDASRYAPVSLYNGVRELAMSAVRVGLVSAAVGCALTFFRLLTYAAPSLAALLAAHGTRTLPVYVLHMLVLEASRCFDVKQLMHAVHPDHRSILCLALAIQATMIFSSRGADAFIGRFVEPPVWVQQCMTAATAFLPRNAPEPAASTKFCVQQSVDWPH